ncbi:MAG: sugar transferase [Lachnospiraceae bacterium]
MNQHKPYGLYEKYIKRPLDVFLATLAIIILSPVLLVTAILVRFKLGSPVLFTQERAGLDGKIFKLYKFRSMTDKKDRDGKLLPDDERLTSFGRTLRSTSFDELPELFNIVKGDMAIIGPRPLLVEYLPYYTEEEQHRHDVRPGLSGLAQVHGRNVISWEEKFAWDLRYVKKITFWGDVTIVLQTVVKTLKRSDILVGKQHKAGRLDVVRAEKMETR